MYTVVDTPSGPSGKSIYVMTSGTTESIESNVCLTRQLNWESTW
jgi:hypothetical protein